MAKPIGEQVIERCKAMHIDSGKVIHVLCWGDVMIGITRQLYERGLKPDDLSNEEIESILNEVREYLEGEDQPLRKVIFQSVQEAWSDRLASNSPKPKDGTCENSDQSCLDQKS